MLLVAVKDDNRVVLTGLTYTLNQLLDLRIRIDEALDCDTIQGRLLKRKPLCHHDKYSHRRFQISTAGTV